MTEDVLLSDLNGTTEALIETISCFTHETFNRKPSETEWSAAQVAEHLLKVGNAACKAVSGETIPTNRPPDAKIAIFKQGLEDDNSKRTAPERLLPSTGLQEFQNIIEHIKKQKDFLENAIHSLDITDACLSFKHTVLGTLTRMEWIYFHSYHVQRHLRQMKRLEEKAML